MESDKATFEAIKLLIEKGSISTDKEFHSLVQAAKRDGHLSNDEFLKLQDAWTKKNTESGRYA